MATVESSLKKLRHYIETQDFAGYDPYDALNSPALRLMSMGCKWPRIAFTQFLRRFPVNLRPLLGVKKEHNPKGIGLFLWGYSKLFAVEQDDKYLKKIDYLLRLLEVLKSSGYSGNCWGYNFDWQNLKMFVPKSTPTIVNSSFIGHALLDVYDATANERALELAISIKDFLFDDLNRLYEEDFFCFSYTPLDNNYVHNANVLGASFLIRLYKILGDPSLWDTALASLNYTMTHQRPDGSWFYAQAEGQHWIDSFHTGFNLQSISYFLTAGEADDHQSAYQKGVRFYAENFFLKDGTPKYYHDRTYPVDIHALAQAIVFFSRMGNDYAELTDKIIQWMISNMLDKRGFFYFQKRKHYTNKIPYIRWGQAWAFHALTEYYLNRMK